jgi:hypothetical protein
MLCKSTYCRWYSIAIFQSTQSFRVVVPNFCTVRTSFWSPFHIIRSHCLVVLIVVKNREDWHRSSRLMYSITVKWDTIIHQFSRMWVGSPRYFILFHLPLKTSLVSCVLVSICLFKVKATIGILFYIVAFIRIYRTYKC